MTIEAINKGEIFRFLLKPWNDEELKVTIRIAFKYHDLITENKRLSKTVEKQSSLLEEIEIKYPGITKVKKDEDGSIIFEDDQVDDTIQTFEAKQVLNLVQERIILRDRFKGPKQEKRLALTDSNQLLHTLHVVSPICSLKIIPTTIKDTYQKAEIINTTLETVEKP